MGGELDGKGLPISQVPMTGVQPKWGMGWDGMGWDGMGLLGFLRLWVFLGVFFGYFLGVVSFLSVSVVSQSGFWVGTCGG